jgi:hypothetical protein
MEECIFLLMVAILALSCLTSCHVSMKLESKVLNKSSKSWLQVWAIMMREPKRGVWGHTGKKQLIKNDRYE